MFSLFLKDLISGFIFDKPGTFIWIDNIPQRRVRLRNKGRLSQHGTAFSNLVFFYGKNKIWRNLRDFRVIQVSVLYIFIATAYDILRFSAKSKIKKKKKTHTARSDPLFLS